MDMSLSKLREVENDRGAWCAAVWSHKESDLTYWLNNNKYVYPEKKFLNHVVSLCFKETMCHFLTAVVPAYSPTRKAQRFCFLHIVANSFLFV